MHDRRPGGGCALYQASPGRPGSMRGTWQRTLARLRNPGPRRAVVTVVRRPGPGAEEDLAVQPTGRGRLPWPGRELGAQDGALTGAAAHAQCPADSRDTV